MRYGSIAKIGWGWLFTFITVDFYHIGDLTQLLGTLLLLLGTWQLREENHYLRSAFRFGIVRCVFIAAYAVLQCTPLASNTAATAGYAAGGVLLAIAVLCSIFAGLYEAAKERFSEPFARKINGCIPLYLLITALCAVGTIVPVIRIPLIPAILILMIVILRRVYGLRCFSESATPLRETPVGRVLPAFLGGGFVGVAAVFFVVLFAVNGPKVATAAFARNDLTDAASAASIRAQMRAHGFDAGILADLPDTEVAYYCGIRAFQKTTFTQNTDGGTLELTSCVSYLPPGDVSGWKKARCLEYYRWVKPPVHTLSDVIGLEFGNSLLYQSPQLFHALSLYDRKTADGAQTFRADCVAVQAEETGDSYQFPKAKIRVFPTGCQNQRGFIAFNVYVGRQSGEAYNTTLVYCHESSILNYGCKDGFNACGGQSLFSGDPAEQPGSTAFPYSRYVFPTAEICPKM